MSEPTDVEHAQRYRSMLVGLLVEELADLDPEWTVFPNPVTGMLVVVNGDGGWEWTIGVEGRERW